MDFSNFIASFGRIDRTSNGNYSNNKLIWKVASECASSLDLIDFIIYIFDQNNHELSQEAGHGYKSKVENELINPLKIKIGQGIVGDSAQKMTFQLVNDTTRDGRYIRDGRRNYSELSVPIVWNGELLGVLDSEHPNKYYFGDFHIEAFYTIASFLGPRLQSSKKAKRRFSRQNKYYCQFIELMEKEQLYKDEYLSLSKVAAILEINQCYLSKIINQASSKKFTDIVNAYRINCVRKTFHLNKHKYYTIMSIAYEAGFASKASFNAAFKRETNMTPSQYIHQLV